MPKSVTVLLGFVSLLAAFLFLRATSDIAQNLSPQGCRMSWMSPSYVLQTGLNETWTPLARRYSLWLYREVGWDSAQVCHLLPRQPVLFIPGNAGSSRQVRSIASSAARQYFSSPQVISPAFQTRTIKPLDFFAVEFNEDLSAFHGTTLESQISYTSAAISYIVSVYPPDTTVIVMGHSMGGIVATALLPSSRISAIITMSTPHTLPPARFDSRIDALYAKLQETLSIDPTPIVSICGGATDMMIPSESCILPRTKEDVLRRTVFSSALEGAWTGVGHREMVWCHQVRWRVARAALELSAERSLKEKSIVLDKWLRDGHVLPPALPGHEQQWEMSSSSDSIVTLAPGENLLLKNPPSSQTYFLPVPEHKHGGSQKIAILVSQGNILSVSPQNPIPLQVSVSTCIGPDTSVAQCRSLGPETLKLIPSPVPGKSFPLPNEGSDESEGVVLFEGYVAKVDHNQWIAVKIDKADGRGWVAAQLSSDVPIVVGANTLSLLAGPLSIAVPDREGLSTSFTFPNLLSHTLLVYRLTPPRSSLSSCSEALFPPLLMHTSHPAETHYFPISRSNGDGRILLHTHLAAPYIDQSQHFPSSLNFTIFSSGETECRKGFSELEIAIDWSATMARWSSRYLTTMVGWSAGIVALVFFQAWSSQDARVPTPSVDESLALFASTQLPYLLPLSFLVSLLPLPECLYLGNKGVGFLAPITPLILLICSGFVCLTWWTLSFILGLLGKLTALTSISRAEKIGVHRTTVLSLVVVCGVIFIFVPWQIAYVGCWLLHLHTCASSRQQVKSHRSRRRSDVVPLVERPGWMEVGTGSSDDLASPSNRRTSTSLDIKEDNLNINMHLLLFMTWLLPLTAPVLAVWVRTLLTAGYTTPFDGDHNFFAVLPFLILTDYASWTTGILFDRPRFENRVSFRWVFAAIAGVAFLAGSRKPYYILDMARIAVWILVVLKVGRRYLGGSPWNI
ncbi:GPI-inositol-deacylase [Agrocybe pediades]|nr:GPI-inositol-deacylase [Agrocybe pediades]